MAENTKLYVGVGVGAAALGLLVILFSIWFWMRRRREIMESQKGTLQKFLIGCITYHGATTMNLSFWLNWFLTWYQSQHNIRVMHTNLIHFSFQVDYLTLCREYVLHLHFKPKGCSVRGITEYISYGCNLQFKLLIELVS